jgi:hypothetical protein
MRPAIKTVQRLLAVALLLLLAASGTALADHLDPKKRIRAADQAKARAMLLRKSDLGPGFITQPTNTPDTHLTCKGLDESDLTVTGEAESPTWTQGAGFVASAVNLYATVTDANASWTRGARGAGTRCLRDELANEFATQGVALESLRKVAFPQVAQRTVAYRVTLSGNAQGVTVRVVIDLVVLMHSRAQAALYFGSAFAPPAKAEEVALARTIARRMATALKSR